MAQGVGVLFECLGRLRNDDDPARCVATVGASVDCSLTQCSEKNGKVLLGDPLADYIPKKILIITPSKLILTSFEKVPKRFDTSRAEISSDRLVSGEYVACADAFDPELSYNPCVRKPVKIYERSIFWPSSNRIT